MKISFQTCAGLFAGFALAISSAAAETRMQVASGSAAVYSQPSAGAQQVGSASSGEILFVSRVEGDWAAISPPDRLALWLNKDFIEGNRVVAKSIQIRSGPGIQYDVVGSLERGAPVMPRGEEGEWCKIAPPSSATLWVRKSDLSEVRTHTTPIEEVAAAPQPAQPVPDPQPVSVPRPAPQQTPPELAGVPEPQPPPAPASQPVVAAEPAQTATSMPDVSTPAATPAIAITEPAQPVVAAAPVKVAASVPGASEPAAAPPKAVEAPVKPAANPAAKPIAKPAPPSPASSRTAAAPAPTLRPATALPAARPAATNPSAPRAAAPARQTRPATAASKAIPAPASAIAAQKPKEIEVKVDPALVEGLDLADLPNQGKSVQVEGELRNAPFMAGSPSRYRLQGRDEDGILEMVCHIHGDSAELRQYVGKEVSIRGREYWVENSDMPVVVVGQIVPLAPTSEPVVF